MGRRKKKSAAWQNSWKVRRKDWIIFLVYTNWIGSCYIPLERRKNKLYNRKKQKEIGQTQKELWIDKKEEKLTFLHSRQVKPSCGIASLLVKKKSAKTKEDDKKRFEDSKMAEIKMQRSINEQAWIFTYKPKLPSSMKF